MVNTGRTLCSYAILTETLVWVEPQVHRKSISVDIITRD